MSDLDPFRHSVLFPENGPWDPTLDPAAIVHAAEAPGRLGPWVGTVGIAALLGPALVLMPMGSGLRSSRAVSEGAPRSVAVTLREVAAPHTVAEGLPQAPGEGLEEPSYAPVARAGMGDLVDLPSEVTHPGLGDLAAAVPTPGATLALGGQARGGGAPWGMVGRGGGLRGSPSTTTRGAPKPLEGLTALPMLVPTHSVTPHKLVTRSQYQATVVVVRLRIAMDGSVTEATVVSGPEHLHDESLRAARKWRFKPLAACGFTEPQQVDIRFHYQAQ